MMPFRFFPIVRALLFGGGSVFLKPGVVLAEATPPVITADVIYGHKAGMALTYDFIKPAHPNGATVLFMVSGGWVSTWADPGPLVAKAMEGKEQNGFGMLLDHGFSLVLVRHGSSPWFRVPDAVEDVRRAVRHVRMHAAAAGLDPDRLGVFGGSAGGHLALMLGTASDAGNAASADPLEKGSDRVAAVVAYYPPTDLANYIGDKRFPALDFPAEKAESVSPLRQVSAGDAPVLLLHGGKDTLVPPSHSENILVAFRKAGVPADLVTFPEAQHGFTGADEKTASTAMVAWFEKYLTKAKPLEVLGSWEVKATLPDGGSRSNILTITETGGLLEALVSGDQGDKRIDRVKVEKDQLVIELDIEREGRKGVIRVEARSSSPGQLTGSWSARDEAGKTLVTGPWEASRK